MTNPATLLLTRPEPQSRAFLADCENEAGHAVPAVISPLLRIEPVGDLPDLEGYDTIIVTSGNGVSRLGSSLAGRRVAAVGTKTAEMARRHGAEATVFGDDVEAFLSRAPRLGRAVFCRGVHSRGELAKRLRAQGNEVDEVVLYDQIAQPLSIEARQLLNSGVPVIAPVFSPRTAALLSEEPHADLNVLAISRATAEAYTGAGNVQIADRPTAEAMRQLVVAAI